jgi:catechol 2,3-dioxygenase-like lactoylglutathione lyase family enzyme
MKNTISRLLKSYEESKLSRRELVEGLALLAAGAGSASAAEGGFAGSTINHVSLYVSDLQRSTDFYQNVLGGKVNKRDGNNQIMFGKDFMVLRPGKPAGKVDHIAIGVDNFNKESVTADLKARGATAKDEKGGVGFYVADPDGFPVQLISSGNTGR